MPRRTVFFPRGCLPWLLVLSFLTGVRVAGAADLPPVGEGEPFVQFWSPRDYHGTTECTSLAQDARGVLYVGNRGLLLEYDGSTWRQIPLSDPGPVTGLAYEARTDTVFVGTQSDLGYLQTEPGGAHKFVSLLDKLPADSRDVGDFYGVYAVPEGVFFAGHDRVLRWRDGRFRTWKPATSTVLRSQWAADHLYLSNPDIGLLRLEGEEFVAASDDPLFRREKVSALLPEPDGSLLVATAHEGMFALRGGAVRPLACDCGDFLKDKGIVSMVRLRDGSLALATDAGAVVVLDPERRFRCRVDKFGGRSGGDVFRLFEDAEGGLWIGMQTGVARAEVASPLSVLRAGPDDDLSSTYAAARWFGTPVVGNSAGIFRLVPAEPVTAVNAHLEHVPGTARASYGMSTVANGTLFLSDSKVVLLDAAGKTVPVAGEITTAEGLLASQVHPGRVYVTDLGGHINQLHLDAATGNWLDDGIVVDVGVTGDSIVAESASGDLWLGTNQHGLFRVRLDPAGPAKVTSFFQEAGALHGVAAAYPLGGAASCPLDASNRLWRFDDASRTIEPLTVFGERFQDGSVNIEQAEPYDTRSLWIATRSLRDPREAPFRGRIIAGGPGRAPVFQALPHKIEEVVGDANVFLLMEETPAPLKSVLLVGSTGNGIVRLDVPRWEAQMREPPRLFTALIRRAFTTPGEGAASASPILREPLEYTRNTAHFEYAAGTLAFGAAPRFQTRLVNFGAGAWSDWSERGSVDYLNLPEGSYTFEVRARNSDGQLGGAAAMPFRVLPPWQRSPWAYAAYLLAAAGGVYALVRWRGRQLRRRNVELEAVVETRTGELVRARDDAETANRAKSAFLANMSHELRTPLNAVLGYTQLLLKESDLTPRSRERITVIGQSGGHLLSLINEVLDLSKVEAGKLTLSAFDFSLGRLLDEVTAALRPRLAEKGLTFVETRAPGLPVTVHTDPSRLRQVLFNLLSNAVKFTERGGVTLVARPTDGQRVRFEVVDTGVGIAPGDQQDIFKAFHQAGESGLASQGTGLGLAISQRLVELLGGHIELESAPGRGSRFWFELPIINVAAADGASKRGAQDAALGRITGYEGETRRLLIVDDLMENRQVLGDFLQPLGFEIEEAADGAACLAACARQTPDGVLLDLRLGAMDGFEVARTLRTRLGGAALSIIAISASVFETDRQQAIDAGCDDFLPKPFEEAQLLGTLGRVLGLRWVRETPAVAEPFVPGAAVGEGETLPADELALLRELSLRGDAAGIHRRLDAWRAEGTPGNAVGIARRLEALVAAYDMETMHEWLLTLHPHDGN